MTGRNELRARLDAAYKLHPDDNGGAGKETYWRTMQAVLAEAETLGDPELLFETRLAYGWALREKSWKKSAREIFTEWLGVLRQCLTAWRAEPDRFSDEHVTLMWNQFTNIVDIITRLFPEPADRVNRLIDELERQCLPSQPDVFFVLDHLRMAVEARRGNLDEVERIWRRLRLQRRPAKHLVPDGSAATTATMWERVGRDDRAIEALTPVLTGQIPRREGHVYEDGLLMPYLRTGRTDEAVAAHQGTYTRPGMKLDEIASHLEFCARTGNVERGLDVLRRNLGRLGGKVTTVEGMWAAAAVALLCRRATERDLDEEWVWPCEDGCECEDAPIRSYAEFGGERRWWALEFALRLDELDGTSFATDSIMKRLHAEPIVEHLELPAPAGEPAHRAKPRPSPHVAATTTDGLRDELAHTREMGPRWRRIVHFQRLIQNAIAAGERDALPGIRLAYLDELLLYGPRVMRADQFAALTALVRLHDADPSLLGAERLDRLWAAVPVVLDRVLTHATVHAAQISGLIDLLGRHCRPGTRDLHDLRWYGVELEVRRADVDAARTAWAAFESLPPHDDYATPANVLRRTGWWLDLGLDTEVLTTMGVALSGQDGEECLIVPYLGAGEAGKAREIHERTRATFDEPRAAAAHLEFCARTGDLARAKEIIQGTLPMFHVFYDDTEFTFDRLRPCAAVVRACRLIVARGLDETWTWPEHTCCPAEEGWTYARLADDYRTELTLFATRWQELTNSDFHTRRVYALADEPA